MEDVLSKILNAQSILWSIDDSKFNKEDSELLDKIRKELFTLQKSFMNEENDYWGNS